MVRIFITYHLTALVLLTNIGVPMFTHICRGQGKTWSSVLLPARSCCSQKKKPASLGPCHTASKYCTPGIQSSPCCENDIAFLQMNVNLPAITSNELISASALPMLLIPFTIHDISAVNSHYYSFLTHSPPIPHHGRSLLLLNQAFRC